MDTRINQEANHEDEIDVLSCTVRNVIYCNEENGYAVLSVTDTDGAEQKMTGTFPYAWPGETITAYGHWGMHGTYGRQFEAESSERSTPEDERSMFSYLASGAVKGIGPVMAGQIVERFGKSALRVLEEEPMLLTEIRGISGKPASGGAGVTPAEPARPGPPPRSRPPTRRPGRQTRLHAS